MRADLPGKATVRTCCLYRQFKILGVFVGRGDALERTIVVHGYPEEVAISIHECRYDGCDESTP